MENKEDILKKINSNEPDLLAEAISEIKENGDISIVSSLLDLMSRQSDAHTTTLLVNLLADIRDNSVKEIIIKRIKATTNIETKALFIRICWESSLDYSDYLDLFVQIMLLDNFAVAFEASTAIENMLHQVKAEKISTLIETLKAIPHTDEQRKFLADNLLQAISSEDEESEG